MLKESTPSIPDFTTINTCINKLNIPIDNDDNNNISKDEYFIIAIYSAEIKVANRDPWMQEK
jgi:hypothetical protein